MLHKGLFQSLEDRNLLVFLKGNSHQPTNDDIPLVINLHFPNLVCISIIRKQERVYPIKN